MKQGQLTAFVFSLEKKQKTKENREKKRRLKKKKDCDYAWVSKLLWKYKEAYEHMWLFFFKLKY